VGRVRTARQPTVIAGKDVNRFPEAGVAVDPLNGPGEHPGVTALERTLAAGFQL
jgi:hypothetical protein